MRFHHGLRVLSLAALVVGLPAAGAQPAPGPGAAAGSNQPRLQISEFLAHNSSGLRDENGDSPDWIEIYNPGPAPVDLKGWHLTDSPAHLRKWSFPSTNLAAQSYMLVFASGKNRSVPGQPLHTSFRLNGHGGSLLLVDPQRVPVDSYLDYPAQEANVAFGRATNSAAASDESAWRYLLRPTPLKPQRPSPDGPGAAIRAVVHSPTLPAAGQSIKVAALIASGSAEPTEVTLHYRVMFDREQALAMSREAEANPAPSRSRTFSAVIPSTALSPGKMIRWYVTATVAGVHSRWPINAGALHLPRYLGTMVARSDLATALPVYDLFVDGYRFPTTESDHAGIDTDAGGQGALYAFGQLYDNVFIRIKGTTSRNLFKRSHRINFNPGHEFRWDPAHAPLRELSLNAEYPDPSYARQYLSCWLQRQTGVGAAPHFPVRAQINGQFWELAFHTMAAGDELLKDLGLDPRGALYKQVEQITPEVGHTVKRTRRREGQSDYLAFVNAINERQPLASRRAALFDRTDLPTVINYIATARITQEADDVWANMVLYRDSNGTGEWRPVPFDLNLSFGQLFYDGDQWNTVINATNDLNKSHPLYGSSATRTRYPANRYHPGGSYFNSWYNRLYDAVIQVPDTRAMLLRRLRTLMDQFLQPPGTPVPQLRIDKELDALAARILPEAELDRKLWGWPPVNPYFGVYGLGPNYGPAKGIADLKNLYLAPRRTHFYVTHSITNTARPVGIRSADNAGIPLPQPPHPPIGFGAAEMSAAAIARHQDYVQLVNTNSFAVDVSGWRCEGAVSYRLRPGTVIAAGQSLYLSPDVVAFRARPASPKGGEGVFVQGSYQRHGSDEARPTLVLRDDTDTVIARTELPALSSSGE